MKRHTRKRKHIRALSLCLPVALTAVTLVAASCRRPDFAGLRAGKSFNVILITVDTLRADRLGCYGFSPDITPAMDLFASKGVLFERCISQTPLTLPSHTTILTGTLPIHHGVRDNGGFVVPSSLVTMAEAFKGKGYETAAFVSAYVLDSKWGLNQGFDYYFDRFDLGRYEKISLGEVQRRADETIDEALAWLEKKKAGKFFAWVHLYDPHTPYAPPEPYKTRFSDRPYLGEVAYTDSELQRLWDFLEREGLTDNLFLIFASDHGESLGEHGETTHGFFVYQAALHVPLIVVTPFAKLRGRRAPDVVSLADVMPTVCDMAGVPASADVQGRSLVPLFFGRKQATDDRLAYSETYYPRFHYGWSELRSFQDARYKLILAPVPELYDLSRDPGEEKNLVYLEKKVFESMSARAAEVEKLAGANALEADLGRVDEDTRERLAALGYIGSFIDQSKLAGRKLADPKEKIGVFNEISKAREAGLGGDEAQAVAALRKIVEEDPTISDAHFALGNVYFKARRFEEAVGAFSRSLELKPDDSFTVINIANCYLGLRRPEEAERFVLDYLKKGFDDPQLYYLLGNLSVHRERWDQAMAYFEECLKRNPQSAAAHNAAAAVCLTRDDTACAEAHLKAAMALNPKLLNVRYNLAQLREKQGRPAEAVELYRQEIADSPSNYKALYNLARLYRIMGRPDEELEALEKAVAANPEFPLSYFFLARNLLNRGRDLERAVGLVNKGLELKPDKANLPLAYFLLADLYNRLGDDARSLEYARKGRALAAEAGSRRD